MSQNGKTTGPFDEERLAMLVHWGKISRDAFICDQQWSAWIAIRRSAFAPLLPSPPADGAADVAEPMELGSKRALGLMALSVILAGLLMAAL
ncbi:MAG TPA: GYF domain-containing protein [Polyangiaceae bacterium]|nr:GYF domain-containing protein [Polyangiaceae bacterium]